jgi:hypothetical protein
MAKAVDAAKEVQILMHQFILLDFLSTSTKLAEI